MAVTMETAEQALKILYLGVVADQLNTKTDPLYNMINKSMKDISGKEVRKMAMYGLNGGVGAGTEDGPLPQAGGNNYIQFVSGTKNLYGVFEITDKAIQASNSNAGAFVSLLTSEINKLMEASKFNLARQLHMDGSGLLATCGDTTGSTTVTVDTTQFLMEGQTIDILVTGTGVPVANGSKRRVLAVDRKNKKIIIDSVGGNVTTSNADSIYVQGSKGLELTGLDEIFKSTGSLYGVDRASNYWMVPYMQDSVGIISEIKIQKAIDEAQDVSGGKINYILTTPGVSRSYQECMSATKRNTEPLQLKGGFTALGYNGMPLISSRFVRAGIMRLLDTTQFTLHHMGDWRWLEGGNGKILQQVAGTPKWTATLVRYCELINDHPGANAQLSGITEDDGIAA